MKRPIATYSYEEISSIIRESTKDFTKSRSQFFLPNGYRFRIKRGGAYVFALKGAKCVSCGVEGTHFDVYLVDEKDKKAFLAFRTDDNQPMTLDHIIPKSKGGADAVRNLQPMCEQCNIEKANTYEHENDTMVYTYISRLKVYLLNNRNKDAFSFTKELLTNRYKNKMEHAAEFTKQELETFLEEIKLKFGASIPSSYIKWFKK